VTSVSGLSRRQDRGRGATPSSRRDALAPTEQLLTQGGDGRIAVDPASGRNRYLCPPTAEPYACFGSSTASVISPRGFAAADRLRSRLLDARSAEAPEASYARELDRIRAELVSLCGLDRLQGLQTLFAASGTDIHLLVGQLLCAGRDLPTFAVGIEAVETGSGVPSALRGVHFSTRTPLGEAVREGAVAGGVGVAGLVVIAAREPDGTPRPASAIAAELEAAVAHFSTVGHVLLTVTDVSKTGLLSFDLAQVLDLRRRFADRVDVLVDACQFRLSAGSLKGYLDQECLVAVTGSKFLGGPTFSGALFVPPDLASRLSSQALRPALSAYAARADLPAGWRSADDVAEAANPGLLLRWEAALAELRAFREIPDWKVARMLQGFGRATLAGLAGDAVFELLPTPRPDRRALGDASWDAVPTIFPFLLRHVADGSYFSCAETDAVYRAVAAQGLQLGQPVACGVRAGAPISALRLCASARLVVEAMTPEGEAAVFQAACNAIRRVAKAARIQSMARSAPGS
jgi:hypothetical protein